MDIPQWGENTIAGMLLMMLIVFIRNTLKNASDKQKADKGVDDRALQWLDEKNAYIRTLESRNDQLYQRNVSLTDEYTSVMRETIGRTQDFKDTISRVFNELKETNAKVAECEKKHEACSTQVEQLQKMIATVAVQAQPAAPSGHTVIPGAGS